MSSDKSNDLHLNLSTTKINPYHIDSPEISPSIFSIDHDESDNPKDLNIDASIKRQFKLFGNQVAGTLPMLHSDGLLYKPLKTEQEKTFYKNIIEWIPKIEPFIPKYSGIQLIKIKTNHEQQTNHNSQDDHTNYSDNEHVNNDNDSEIMVEYDMMEDANINNNLWSQQMYKKNKHRIAKMPFLILEDITKLYHKPCILDLKIGTRHFAPICKMDKMERKLRKAWCSTCKDFGVRIGGIQMYDNNTKQYNTMAKDKGMVLDKEQFCNEIVKFFKNGQDEILKKFITKLDELMEILKDENRFRWFSCSLLFVYEGFIDKNNGNCNNNHNHKYEKYQNKGNVQILKQEKTERKMDGEKDDYNHYNDFDVGRLDLRIIDFTNFVIVKNYLDDLTKSHNHNNNDNDDDHELLVDDEEEDKNGEYLQLNKDLDNLDEPDHGLLFGLDSLIQLLKELEKNGNIKTRNDKEWIKFRDDITYSKKALIPFKNTHDFNENTKIQ